jgi:hypothetical protein
MAIHIVFINSTAMPLHLLRSCGYDTRALSKFHDVFGCCLLGRPKETDNTRDKTAASSLTSPCSSDFREYLQPVTEPPSGRHILIIRALKPKAGL